MNYGWSEEKIFSLPFVRLRAYQEELYKDQGGTVMVEEPSSTELEELQKKMIEQINGRK